MSKLKELIEKLCSDGVIFKTLGELHSDKRSIMRGIRITKKDLIENGQYKVYGGGEDIIFGYYNKYNIKKDTVTINVAGSVGFVDYITEDSWIVDSRYAFFTNQMNLKFLYYALKNKENELRSFVKGAIPGINMDLLMKVSVPIPPMEVQREIVRILDNFTELTAELTAELEARTKQFEYYQKNLLGFKENKNIKWIKIEDLFNIRNGYTPSTKNSRFWENGTIPWFRMEDIRTNGRLLSDSIRKITKEAVKGNLFEPNSIIISTSATIGEYALINVPYLSNQRFTNLSLKEEFKDDVEIKFMYHYMYVVSEWCKKNITESSFASVDMASFRKLQIPIPPLDEQERIVSILDKFSTLVNDIKEGLPAEINLRRKQYEYYRNKLLTFE